MSIEEWQALGQFLFLAGAIGVVWTLARLIVEHFHPPDDDDPYDF